MKSDEISRRARALIAATPPDDLAAEVRGKDADDLRHELLHRIMRTDPGAVGDAASDAHIHSCECRLCRFLVLRLQIEIEASAAAEVTG